MAFLPDWNAIKTTLAKKILGVSLLKTKGFWGGFSGSFCLYLAMNTISTMWFINGFNSIGLWGIAVVNAITFILFTLFQTAALRTLIGIDNNDGLLENEDLRIGFYEGGMSFGLLTFALLFIHTLSISYTFPTLVMFVATALLVMVSYAKDAKCILKR